MVTCHARQFQLVRYCLLLRSVGNLLLFRLVHSHDLGTLTIADGVFKHLLLNRIQLLVLVCLAPITPSLC